MRVGVASGWMRRTDPVSAECGTGYARERVGLEGRELDESYKLVGFTGPVWMNLWSLMDGKTRLALGDPVLK